MTYAALASMTAGLAAPHAQARTVLYNNTGYEANYWIPFQADSSLKVSEDGTTISEIDVTFDGPAYADADLVSVSGANSGSKTDYASVSDMTVTFGQAGSSVSLQADFAQIDGLVLNNQGESTTYYLGSSSRSNSLSSKNATAHSFSNITIHQDNTDAATVVFQSTEAKSVSIDGLTTDTAVTTLDFGYNATASGLNVTIQNLDLAEGGELVIRNLPEAIGQQDKLYDDPYLTDLLVLSAPIGFANGESHDITISAQAKDSTYFSGSTYLSEIAITGNVVEQGYAGTIVLTGEWGSLTDKHDIKDDPNYVTLVSFAPSDGGTLGSADTNIVMDGNGTAQFVLYTDGLSGYEGTLTYTKEALAEGQTSARILLLQHGGYDEWPRNNAYDTHVLSGNVTLDGALAFDGKYLESYIGIVEQLDNATYDIQTISDLANWGFEQRIDLITVEEGSTLVLGDNFAFAAAKTSVDSTLSSSSAKNFTGSTFLKIGDTYGYVWKVGTPLTAYLSGKLDADALEGGGDGQVSSVYTNFVISGLELFDNYMLPLGTAGSTLGSADHYLDLRGYDPATGERYETCTADMTCGIFGQGGISVSGTVYLGGTNRFTGTTLINENASLHVQSNRALAQSSVLVVEDGGSLYFDDSSQLADFSFDSITLNGNAYVGSASSSQDVSHTSITVAGTNASVSYLANGAAPVVQALSAVAAASETEPDATLVTVSDVDLKILDGAVFDMNYASGVRSTFAAASAPQNTLAVLELVDSTLLIEGAVQDADGTIHSSHLYVGNAVLQVDGTSALSFGENSAIHLGVHADGSFEANEAMAADSHDRYSIEVKQGASVSLTLAGENHVYADHIIDVDHTHKLLGRDEGAATDERFFEYAAIGLQADASQLNEAARQAIAAYDAQWGTTLLTDLEAGTTLSEIYQAAAARGMSETTFYSLMGDLLTTSLAQDVHGAWQEYYLTVDADGVYLSASKAAAPEEFKQWLSLQTSTDTVLDIMSGTDTSGGTADSSNSGAYRIISAAIDYAVAGVSDNPTQSDYDRGGVYYTAARMIDAAGQIATVGGAQTLAWDVGTAVEGVIDRRLKADRAENLWVEGLYLNTNSYGMWNDFNGDRQNKADLTGFIVGAQAAATDSWKVGASLSYMQGDAEDEFGFADQVQTTNEMEFWNFSLFTRYDMSDYVFLTAKAGVQQGGNELVMRFPLGLVGDTLTADADTRLLDVGMRLHGKFEINPEFVVTPYMGIKYSQLTTGEYTSKLGDLAAFHTQKSVQNIVSVPVGVMAQAVRTYANGSAMRLYLDAYVQPNFGDTEVENRVQGESLTVVDTVHPEVIGELGYGVAVGADWSVSENWTGGVQFSIMGSEANTNQMLSISAKYQY